MVYIQFVAIHHLSFCIYLLMSICCRRLTTHLLFHSYTTTYSRNYQVQNGKYTGINVVFHDVYLFAAYPMLVYFIDS